MNNCATTTSTSTNYTVSSQWMKHATIGSSTGSTSNIYGYSNYHVSIPEYDQKIQSIYEKIEQICNQNFIKDDSIMNIKIFKENKVVGITFYDGTKIKTVCSDNDEFSLEYACYLALAKKLYSKEYTFEGVLCKVNELQQIKIVNKMVTKAIKQYYNEEKAKAEEKEKEKEEKEIKARRLEKKRKKKKNKQVKEIQEIINQLYDPMVKMAKEINNPISQIAQTINK